jgi:hypothetical protein
MPSRFRSATNRVPLTHDPPRTHPRRCLLRQQLMDPFVLGAGVYIAGGVLLLLVLILIAAPILG